jgi:hydrogenase-4 component B
MDGLQLIISSLVLTIAGTVLIPLIPGKSKAVANFIFVLFIAILTSIPAINALTGNPLDIVLSGMSFFEKVPLRIDALSAWFMLIINLTCVNGALYGIGYMKPYSEQKANLSLHWVLFLIFQSSMLWVCMLQHSLAFLIAWELMSLSSMLLVIFEHQKRETLKAGMNYLVQMHIGVAFLSAAFIWVYFAEGSFDFHAISSFFGYNTNVGLFLLFFAGFGIKAGFIPLHSWLPHAHPAAPSHISGVMSGVIVKLGIYGIIRIALMLKADLLLIGESLLVLSILTGIYGILNAAVHRDFKKMLAYCTIENIGVIGAGIGLMLIGMAMNNPVLLVLGLSGALLHTLNHSLFKSLLFFSAGSVYQQTHTRDMEKLGGLVHKMPQTALLFLLGSLAIGGLPPFNGFVSEFIIYSGLLNGVNTLGLTHSTLMMLSLAGLALIGGLSLLTFTKSFGTIFLGSPREQLHSSPAEVSLVMRIPQYLIIAIMLSIGLFPQFYFSAVLQLIAAMTPLAMPDVSMFQPTLTLMAGIGKYSMIFLIVLIVVFLVRYAFIRNRSASISTTWGCGYVAPYSKMQYTGKSFSKTLGKLFGFVVAEKKKYKELTPVEIFPHTRKHTSYYNDFFEDHLIQRVMDRFLFSMNYFQFIQNGKTYT